ncbi:glycosyl hydrolase family 8 [Ornithinibacillus caprae]|uniref:glycosyl hydrolase family 8 n=1 Tax=Ornithinibacillus caprae TaxID=2678566 RepID=UPI0018C5D334|nr:glycosyl hydrolase family 8 [Ornithinibacillus caprae]
MAIIIIVCTSILIGIFLIQKQEVHHSFATEKFIKRWLMNENGTLATYIKESNQLDEDLVQGREALSETLGLWMQYALEEENEQLFQDAFEILTTYFLEKDGFIHWKLNQSGVSEVDTNALVDDLRIISGLLSAYRKWENEQYMEVARIISNYISRFNVTNNILTDFYDRKHQYSSDVITLSYIDPEPLEQMFQREYLDKETYRNTMDVLVSAPLEHGFYPKSYHETKQTYLFEGEINMVDQALVAYHLAKLNIVSNDFVRFVEEEIAHRGVVNGKYEKSTKKPVVTYESPAVYGILILFSIESNNYSLAEKLYERMKVFRNDNKKHNYYGGYSVSLTGDTHIFDNLVPLFAEKKLMNSWNN